MSRGSGRSRRAASGNGPTLPLPLGIEAEPAATVESSITVEASVTQPDAPGPSTNPDGLIGPLIEPDPISAASTKPDPMLAQSWLAEGFADHLLAWARRMNAPEASLESLRAAGRAVSLAIGSGHACIELREIATNPDDLRAALLASTMVGTADRPGASPLVLDAEDRLYLHRYFDYERRIARRLAQRSRRVLDATAETRLASRLAELFAGNAQLLGNRPDWQKLAATLAVLNDVTIISGGPGTGKTTTVVNLLACLLELEPECRIALAAPTGKAAARMQDAIRERAAHLPENIQAHLPKESFTIHRLLGVVPDSNTFRHHAGNPLAIDVLVVDEASMLDLALAAKLFEAVPPSARIILLGDKDQLAAVESGAVFSELSADPTLSAFCIGVLSRVCGIPAPTILPPVPVASTPLHDSVVWFTQNFRFATDSGIGRLAHEINAGDAAALLLQLRSGDDASVTWLDDPGATLAAGSLVRLRDGYAPYVAALRAFADHGTAASGASAGRDAGQSLTTVFDAFERFRILCAERQGPRGVRSLNEIVSRYCRDALDDRSAAFARSPWYFGRPVMVLRNDYVLKLYNGDVGITLPDDAGELMVHFRETDGSLRAIAPVRLPEHETAFANTVHKAQGSEFEEIALVLPGKPSRVLTRELVYTAVTRARHRVALVTGAEVLEQAVEACTLRHSGLIARLREAGRADARHPT